MIFFSFPRTFREGGSTMHPAVHEAVSYELARALREVESRRDILVSAELQSFMNGIISESLDVRQGEWKNRGLDPNNPKNSSEIASQISNVVRFLAGEAETYMAPTGSRRVLLVGLLELAHNKWC